MVPIFNDTGSHFIAYKAPDFSKDEASWGSFTRIGQLWPFEAFSIAEDATTMIHYFGLKGYKMATDFITHLPTDFHRAVLHTFQPWIRFRKDTEPGIRAALDMYSGELYGRNLQNIPYRRMTPGEYKGVEPRPSSSQTDLLTALTNHTSSFISIIGRDIRDYLYSEILRVRPYWQPRIILGRIQAIAGSWIQNLPPADTPSYNLESDVITRLSYKVENICAEEIINNYSTPETSLSIPSFKSSEIERFQQSLVNQDTVDFPGFTQQHQPQPQPQPMTNQPFQPLHRTGTANSALLRDNLLSKPTTNAIMTNPARSPSLSAGATHNSDYSF